MKSARSIRFLTLLFISFLWLVLPASASEEDTTTISALDVQPSTVQVSRFELHPRVSTTVVARLAGNSGVPSDLTLSVTASPGLEVKTGERTATTGDITWPVSIRSIGDGPDEGFVDFRLAYLGPPVGPPVRATRGGAGIPVVLVRHAQLKVRLTPDRDASPVDDAEMSLSTDAVASTGSVIKGALLIRNKSNYPFDAGPIEISRPDFLKMEPGQSAVTVGAHETVEVPLEIKVVKPQPAGDWLIVAGVPIKRGSGEAERRGKAVVQQTIRAGTSGMSHVAQAFDLPSLLLIPGALVLTVLSMLLDPGEAASFRWLDWRTSDFWVVAIGLSIVIFGVFSIFHTESVRSASLSVAEVATLWFACIVGTGALFYLYRLGMHRMARRAELERSAHEPVIGDQPIFILDKLDRANMPFHLQSYQRDEHGQLQRIYELGFSAPVNMAWMVPEMQLEQLKFDQAADRQVRLIMEANSRPEEGRAALVAMLKQALQQKQIRLTWRDGSLRGPQTVGVDHLGVAGGLESPLLVG